MSVVLTRERVFTSTRRLRATLDERSAPHPRPARTPSPRRLERERLLQRQFGRGRHVVQIHRHLRQQLAAGDSHLRPERQRLVLERRLGRGAVRQARLDVLELRGLRAFV